jgi:hypothetical protein
MAERDILYARLNRRQFLGLAGLGTVAALALACGQKETPPSPEEQFRGLWKREDIESALVTEDGIFVTEYDNTLLKLDIRTGKESWAVSTYAIPNYYLDGNLYSAKNGLIRRFDGETGELIWGHKDIPNPDLDENVIFEPTPIFYDDGVFELNPVDYWDRYDIPKYYVNALSGEFIDNYVPDPNALIIPPRDNSYGKWKVGDVNIGYDRHMFAVRTPSGHAMKVNQFIVAWQGTPPTE